MKCCVIESVWQMGLGGEEGGGYPERPNEADCIFYLRTGYCGYGPRCRFNHPRDRAAVIFNLSFFSFEFRLNLRLKWIILMGF